MPPVIKNLAAVLRAAELGQPITPQMIEGASRELVTIVDAPEPDRRKVITHTRGKDIRRLKNAGVKQRADICERLGISFGQYERAKKALTETSGEPFNYDRPGSIVIKRFTGSLGERFLSAFILSERNAQALADICPLLNTGIL